mgnify:FL=1
MRGVATTASFHKEILADPRFLAGDYDTSFVETMAPRELRT